MLCLQETGWSRNAELLCEREFYIGMIQGLISRLSEWNNSEDGLLLLHIFSFCARLCSAFTFRNFLPLCAWWRESQRAEEGAGLPRFWVKISCRYFPCLSCPVASRPSCRRCSLQLCRRHRGLGMGKSHITSTGFLIMRMGFIWPLTSLDFGRRSSEKPESERKLKGIVFATTK